MPNRNPLTPLAPLTFPTRPGQVFRRERYFGDERRPGDNSTYLFAGIEHRDAVTGELHDEKQFLFIVWQGTALVFRTRATEAQIKNDLDLVERRSGLDQQQMAFIAEHAFSTWQELEYRKMGVLT